MANEPYIEVYKRFCKLAATDEKVFKTFKSHPDYVQMLEHVSEEQGFEYLRIIKDQNPQLLDHIHKFRENDRLGAPNAYEYRDAGVISPTTLRYVKTLSDMIEMYDTLEGEDIIEVGGGYGGQCKIISDVFAFKSYTIVDLPEVVGIINRYLKENNVPNAKAITLEELSGDKWGLFISNYAFTELPSELQLTYIERVTRKCAHAYITCNFCGNPAEATSLPKEALLKEFKCIELDEVPKTHPNNCLLVW
jgi:putative sugar O-methyltransferase